MVLDSTRIQNHPETHISKWFWIRDCVSRRHARVSRRHASVSRRHARVSRRHASVSRRHARDYHRNPCRVAETRRLVFDYFCVSRRILRRALRHGDTPLRLHTYSKGLFTDALDLCAERIAKPAKQCKPAFPSSERKVRVKRINISISPNPYNTLDFCRHTK